MTLSDYSEDEKVEVRIADVKMFEGIIESYEISEKLQGVLLMNIDTYLVLDEEQEKEFDQRLDKKEVPKTMKLMTSFERKAREETLLEVAKKLKNINFPLEGICDITEFPIDKVAGI